MRRAGTGLVGLVVAALVCAFLAPPALASSVTLYAGPHGSGSTCSSADPCSLQSALDTVDTASDTYVINVAAGSYARSGGYTIGVGGAAESLTLAGAGAADTILNGGFMSSEPQEGGNLTVDEAAEYPVTIDDMTIENGYGASPLIGADVDDSSPDQLTLDDDVIDGGDSPSEGLVGADNGPVEIENSTVENAYSSSDTHGAIAENAASLTIEDSTFNGDPVGDVVIYAGGSASIADSTFVGERSGDDGAIADASTGTVVVLDSTFSDDGETFEAMGEDNGGTAVAIEFGDDILAGADNCQKGDGGTYTDLGENVETDASCPTAGGNDKQSVSTASLALGTLADNGGPTETEKITTASAAHDLAPTGGLINFACGGDDQRGLPREQTGATKCDVGAYVVAPPALSSAAPTGAESGATVKLTGVNLSDVTSVKFGSVSAAIAAQTQTSLTVTIPSVPEGLAPITVTNSDGSASLAYSISGPLISTRSLAAGNVGSAYSQTLAASGGVGPFVWKLTSGKLPAGLTLSSAGVISGKPTATGTFRFSVSVTDTHGESATSSLSLTVPPAVVTIKSSKLRVEKSRIVVSLSCASDPCAGTIKLTSSKGKELASVSYKLAAGTVKAFELRLTKDGRKAFKHVSKRKPVKANVSASVSGGATAVKKFKVT